MIIDKSALYILLTSDADEERSETGAKVARAATYHATWFHRAVRYSDIEFICPLFTTAEAVETFLLNTLPKLN